jgi:methylglutaconyl-CoA hydratase
MGRLVLRSQNGGVRTLTLNRPERRNALTPAMQDELIAELVAAGDDPEVKVLILTGAGDGFCGGLDISALQGMLGKTAEELEEDSRRIARMFQALYNVPVPTIAAVNGHSVAGGAGFATICDFTLAVAGAKFGYTEVKIGFVPALVSAYLMIQVGEKRARELLLTGRLFTAEEAYRLGLVTEVVTDLAASVEALCAVLLANSPASLRATKRLERSLAESMLVNAAIRKTRDFGEGITAFLEKRKPHWE